MKTKILIFVIIFTGLFPLKFLLAENIASNTAPDVPRIKNERTQEMLDWAKERKIFFVGVNNNLLIPSSQFATDIIPMIEVPNTQKLLPALQKLPDHLIRLLENNTIVVSTKFTWENCKIHGLNDGFFLCQPLGYFVHEIGHRVDFYGIKTFALGKTDEENKTISEEYKRIFSIPADLNIKPSIFPGLPAGFLTSYSKSSIFENFADHFSRYAESPELFRERAVKDPGLAEKYEFLKTKIFLGKEYFEEKSIINETKPAAVPATPVVLEKKEAESKTTSTPASVQTNIFIKTLQHGTRGDEVKKLQEFLKKSPDIYPEGLITGYFGPLTEAAVKRLQGKYGIEIVGIVGPKTRAKINELVLTKPTSTEKTEKPASSQILTPPAGWPDWLKKEWENNIEDVRKFEEEVKKWGWKSLQNEDLPRLLQWADENKIRIIRSGAVQDVAEGSLTAVPDVNEVFRGFKAIPPHLIKVLENETVNLVSNLEGSGGCWAYGTAAVVNIGVKEEIKMKVNFSLCRPFNAGIVVHEVGHIVDEIKIRNIKGNEFSLGQTDEKIRVLREEYDRIFQVSEEYQRMYSERLFTAPPPGFISIYAARSESENFADHFRDYIFNAQYFRERAAKESLLAEKYEFLKTKIFLGKEY